MAKASKTTATKAEKPAAKAKKGKSPQVTTVLDAPKPDPDRAPREDNYGRKERQTPKPDINGREEGEDKVYGISSRARWGGTESTQELAQDAQAAEESANENREE